MLPVINVPIYVFSELQIILKNGIFGVEKCHEASGLNTEVWSLKPFLFFFFFPSGVGGHLRPVRRHRAQLVQRSCPVCVRRRRAGPCVHGGQGEARRLRTNVPPRSVVVPRRGRTPRRSLPARGDGRFALGPRGLRAAG